MRLGQPFVERQGAVQRLLRAGERLHRHHAADSADDALGLRLRDRGIGQCEERVARDRLLVELETRADPAFVNSRKWCRPCW